MGCATGIVKTLVFVFNLGCAIVATVLIAVGSLFYVAINEVDELTKGNFTVAPALVIAVGVIVFVISFLGCCGVCQKSSCMLITYAVILLLLLIVQIVAGIYGFVQVKNGADLEKEIKNNVWDSLKTYNKNDVAKDAWDSVQKSLKCCGVGSATDWENEGVAIPKSCCDSETTTCNRTSAYEKGCYTDLYDIVTGGVKVVSYIALGIAAVEFLAALFAIFLVNSMKNEGRRGYA